MTIKTPLTGWPVHLVTTFNKLHASDACVEGYGKLANFIRDHLAVTPKDFGMDRPIPIALILESNGFNDALWTIRNAVEQTPERDRFLRLLACDWAEHVLPIFEKRRPDDNRPRHAINMARAFARGECTATELAEAKRDAYAAAATDAAYADAAYAYADATAAAAYAAYAAYADAYAYADAAYADAYAYADAARRAEKQWQSDRFAQALADEFAGCAATADKAAQAASEEA